MKVSYDSRTDTLSVIFRSDVAVAESDETKAGIVIDYDPSPSSVATIPLPPMTDLLDRLESAFAERCTVEQEVGSGGLAADCASSILPVRQRRTTTAHGNTRGLGGKLG